MPTISGGHAHLVPRLPQDRVPSAQLVSFPGIWHSPSPVFLGSPGRPAWRARFLAPEPSLPRRETLQRLELENKRLCQQEAADRERQEELQRHLEEANRDRHRLETQHR